MERLTVKEAAILSGHSESWWRKKILEKKVPVLRCKMSSRIFIPKKYIDGMFESENLNKSAKR